MDLNLFRKVGDMRRLSSPFMPSLYRHNPMYRKYRGGDVSQLVRDAQRASQSQSFQSSTSPAAHVAAVLGFIAPILLPFLVKGVVDYIKKHPGRASREREGDSKDSMKGSGMSRRGGMKTIPKKPARIMRDRNVKKSSNSIIESVLSSTRDTRASTRRGGCVYGNGIKYF